MIGIVLSFFLLNLLFAFVLLYPLYLRDNNPARIKGVWQSIGSLFKKRYWAVWVLNLNFGLYVSATIGVFTQKDIIRLLAMLLYFLIITPTLLWYPFYLKENKPEKYTGIWGSIGEWLGDPRAIVPSRRK